jgi:hypothetical protein
VNRELHLVLISHYIGSFMYVISLYFSCVMFLHIRMLWIVDFNLNKLRCHGLKDC